MNCPQQIDDGRQIERVAFLLNFYSFSKKNKRVPEVPGSVKRGFVISGKTLGLVELQQAKVVFAFGRRR